MSHGLVSRSLFWVLLDEQWPEVESVLADHESLLEKTFWLLGWSRLLVGHEDVSVELVDRWELTDSLETEVESPNRSNDLKLEDLREGSYLLAEELNVDLLGLFWSEYPASLIFGHWWKSIRWFSLALTFSGWLTLFCACWSLILWKWSPNGEHADLLPLWSVRRPLDDLVNYWRW